MKNSQQHSEHCPDLDKLERLAVRSLFSAHAPTSIQPHEPTCQTCRSAYLELRRYYQLLREEMQQPVSPKIVDFVRELEGKESAAVLFD
ncbi:MAG: hypothetical protein ACE5HO_02965 [bacterium]